MSPVLHVEHPELGICQLGDTTYLFHRARIVQEGETTEVTAIRWRYGRSSGLLWYSGSAESFVQLAQDAANDEAAELVLATLLYEASEWQDDVVVERRGGMGRESS